MTENNPLIDRILIVLAILAAAALRPDDTEHAGVLLGFAQFLLPPGVGRGPDRSAI
jgi:hypothetical protein